MNQDEALLFHDEGVVDIAVSTAEAINFRTRLSASFTTFQFVAELMISQGRADLAVLLLSTLFPRARSSHPIFSAPDQTMWREIQRENAHLELYPPAKGFLGVTHSVSGSQFQSVARIIFLAHELGHYLSVFPQSKRLCQQLNVSPQVLDNNEALADVLGAVFTVSALSRSIDFRRPGSMTWLVAKVNLLLQIHHAFVEVRRMTAQVIDHLGTAAEHTTNVQLDDRSKLVDRELSDPAFIQAVFRLRHSRAKVIEPTLVLHRRYAKVVVDSVKQSAKAMLDELVDALALVKPIGTYAGLQMAAHEVPLHGVQWLVREALGADAFRLLSVYSNQADLALRTHL